MDLPKTLNNLKSINSTLLKLLQNDGYTLESLARASVYDLEKYPKIGKAKAREIIEEANSLLIPPPQPQTDDNPPMSAKIKRIQDSL